MNKLIKYFFRLFLNVFFSNNPNRVRQVFLSGRSQFVWVSEHVGRKILLRIFERNETVFFQQHLKQGDICFDVGANVGYYTNLFASKVGNKGQVIAVEPIQRNVLLIELASLINNTDKNVKVFCAAISNNNNSLSMVGERDSSYANVHENTDESTKKVKAITLDSLFTELNIPKIDILKMDIEGWEHKALEGMKGILSDPQIRPRLMMIELYTDHLKKYGASITEICTYLKQFDYEAKVLDKNNNLITFMPIHHDNIYNVFFIDGNRA